MIYKVFNQDEAKEDYHPTNGKRTQPNRGMLNARERTVSRSPCGHYSNTRKRLEAHCSRWSTGQHGATTWISGLPPKEPPKGTGERGRGGEGSTVGRRGTQRGERFFWWRTPCNTWQYLVSGPRSPAGSTLFYSIRGAAIRFSAPRIHSSVAAVACGSTGDTRPP